MIRLYDAPLQGVDIDDVDAGSLRASMLSDGYTLIRRVIAADTVGRLLGNVTAVLDNLNWFAGGTPGDRVANLAASCCDPEPAYLEAYSRVFRLESLHALPHDARIGRITEAIVCGPVLIHPKIVVRLVFPQRCDNAVGAHQDYWTVRGTPDTYTAWMPLHDCGPEEGPLQILEGSHRSGLHPACHGRQGSEIEQTLAGAWLGGAIRAGDLLIFHSHTVHRASINASSRLRISIDFRFQSWRAPIHPAAFVLTGGDATWASIYDAFGDGGVGFYWKKRPVILSPSLSDLRRMAASGRSDSTRHRAAHLTARLTEAFGLTD